MGRATNRVVVVVRETELEALLARHSTREQARFFLESRDQSLEDVEERHNRHHEALHRVIAAIPLRWRRNIVERSELDRFLFEPDDTVAVIGQDGLVANVAKYLEEQPVLGINPDPARYDGVLVPLAPEEGAALLETAAARRAPVEARTMVEARLDDGQRLTALNEVFIGHQTHQSARYRIAFDGREERQSSSGVIVTTGTGATGWARSINGTRGSTLALPSPEDAALAFFVREPFPSVATGTAVSEARMRSEDTLTVTSEMNSGGVVFGDGIEVDRLRFDWGMRLHVQLADRRLHLVNHA